MRILLIFLSLFLSKFSAIAQTGVIRGNVVDKLNHQPVAFAPIGLAGTGIGVSADANGVFEINGLAPGIYNLEVKVVGFKPYTLFEVQVSSTRIKQVEIELEEQLKELNEVEVRPDPFVKIDEAPLSQFSIGEVEIKRNPGSNRDVSKALQSLPGVAATASFRNDLIVRGGCSNENRFYLDGVEVPNINHFSTQGATGGPVGMINVDFIREVDFYSGSFPTQRGNALSSVLDFKLKDGRTDKTGYALTLGATDLAATVDGPIGKNAAYIASWRRSYLQFLFQALGLPFLPRYDDFLFKTKIKLDEKNEVSFIGLGAYDVVTLNTKDNETDFQKYVIGYLPENNQWNYTVGAVYKHYRETSYSTFVLSRNELYNTATKYFNNDPSSSSNLLLHYASRETENKVRWENTFRVGGFKLSGGINFEDATYTTNTFNKVAYVGTINYASKVQLLKYGIFGQATGHFLDDKLATSFGFRADANNYSSLMSNPLKQFSPRISFTYAITPNFRINTNAGIYYQLPPYTVLGYQDSNSTFVNRETARYIRCDHYVAGLEYTNDHFLRITMEVFDKQYSNYPFNLRDSLSLANQGNDFGVIGNTPVVCDNKGRSQGLELMLQQKFSGRIYGILAYTFLRSQFQGIDGNYIASSWDFRHTLSLTGGYYFKRNWEFGMRFRYNSGQPYTPIDVDATLVQSTWDVTGVGIPDRSAVNQQRTAPFQQVDVRLDKKYFFKKWSLNLYLDIQNLLNYKTELPPYISVQRDASGSPVPDPANPSSYEPLYITNESGSVIPTFGFVIEF